MHLTLIRELTIRYVHCVTNAPDKRKQSKGTYFILDWALTISYENQLVSSEGGQSLLWYSTTIIWVTHPPGLTAALLHPQYFIQTFGITESQEHMKFTI